MTPEALFAIVETCELTNQRSLVLTMPRPKRRSAWKWVDGMATIPSPFGRVRVLNETADKVAFMVEASAVRKWLAKAGFFES